MGEQMVPYRSMLFVPGHKETWIDKAVASGADALILDLEDAVPTRDKGTARAVVRAASARLRSTGVEVGIWVRPNSWESGLAGLDLEKVVSPEVDGLFVPKVYDKRDVLRFETLLEHFERMQGIPVGHTKLILTLETAQAMAACEGLAACSPRVVSMLGATARDADITRALGYVYTPSGIETLYLRSKVVLACRAAGLDHPVCGLWQDIHDLSGLETFAQQNRELGYRGQVILHPSHVAPVHAVFTPTQTEVEYYRGMVAAFEEAERVGSGAVMYVGQHIDAAHAKTAKEWLDRWHRIEAMSAPHNQGKDSR